MVPALCSTSKVSAKEENIDAGGNRWRDRVGPKKDPSASSLLSTFPLAGGGDQYWGGGPRYKRGRRGTLLCGYGDYGDWEKARLHPPGVRGQTQKNWGKLRYVIVLGKKGRV